MLQTRKFTQADGSGFSVGRPSPTKRRAILVAAGAERWTLENIINFVRSTPFKKAPLQPTKSAAAQRAVESEPVRLALPDTFQRLSPELFVLLDPKHDRLVYLLSVDEASSADAVAGQLRGLLRAAAAPYVHLMALPAGLRSALLRELPGGWPVVSSVPLPVDLAAALQQQQQHGQQSSADELSHGREMSPRPTGERQGLAAAERPGSRQWAPGGVLELLYGNSELAPGGSLEDVVAAASADGTRAALRGGDSRLSAQDDAEARDVPDEVLSRRRRMVSLMRWRKGASVRVARRRSEHTTYQFDWMIEGFNSPDALSVVAATPNMILIRNNVDANLEVDLMQGEADPFMGNVEVEAGHENEDNGGGVGAVAATEEESGMPEDLEDALKAFGILDSDSDSDGDDDDEPAVLVALDDDNDDDDGVIKLIVDNDDEDDDDEEEEDGDGEMPAALMSLLGLQGTFRQLRPGVLVRVEDDDDDGDSDDEDGEAGTEANEEEDGATAPAALMSLLARQGGFRQLPSGLLVPLSGDQKDDTDDDEAQAKQGEAKEEEENGDGLTPAALMSLLGRQEGPFRQLLPGVFVRVVNDDDNHGKSNDGGFLANVDDDSAVPETLDVQLSPGPMGWTASLRLGREEGQGELDGAAAAAQRESLLKSLRVDVEYLQNIGRLEALWEAQAREDSQQPEPAPRLGQGPEQGSGRGTSPPSPAGPEGSGADAVSIGPASLEADWRQAEIRAAALARSTGEGVRAPPPGGVGTNTAAAARGSVPTDRLMEPPRPPGLPDLSSDGFVASTRSRRRTAAEGPGGGAAASDDSSAGGALGDIDGGDSVPARPALSDEGEEDAGADGPAPPARSTGRSRMVRRPQVRMRRARQPPGPSGRDAELGSAQDASGCATASSASPDASALSDTASGAHVSASPSTSSVASSAGSGSNSNSDDAVTIPAYRHLRHADGSTGFAAGAGGEAAGAHGGSRPPWARAGSAASAPQQAQQGTGSAASGSGAAASGGAAGDGLTPEAAGYAGLDLEQLAQFVLGRNASPEEVQDLARAVAQSAEVEEVFGGFAGPQQGPAGEYHRLPLSHRCPWRRPGTPPPSQREVLGGGRSRRSVVTPRQRRLRIPKQVLRLAGAAAKRQEGERQSDTPAADDDGAGPQGSGPAADRHALTGRRRRLSGLMLRRLGRREGAESAVEPLPAQAAAARQPQEPQQQPRQQQATVSQEELAEAMLAALHAAQPLERQAAEALVAFLRGRCLGQQRDQTQQPQQRGVAEVLRSRAGLPGLVRGRDAVVVLPRSLLEATAGVWHEQEKRLMHEDYRVGRGGA